LLLQVDSCQAKLVSVFIPFLFQMNCNPASRRCVG
jgi:hypothetical protein